MSTPLEIGRLDPRRRNNPLTERQLFFIVVVASLGMRLLAMFRVGILCTDGLLYTQIATEILEGRWLESNRTLLFNPYPASIALVHLWTGLGLEQAGMLLNSLFGGLAVVPLYLWCREAFDRRIALTAGWIYALHPMLIRFSVPMMRDGMYWFCLLAGIQLGWSALQRGSFLRYFFAGLFVTCAMLCRTEGIAVYGLLSLWGIFLPRFPSEGGLATVRRFVGNTVAVAVLPLALVCLNLAILPAGEPLSGFERLGFLSPALSKWVSGLRTEVFSQEVTESRLLTEPHGSPEQERSASNSISEVTPDPQTPATVSEASRPQLPTVQVSHVSPPLLTLNDLMDRIPIWNEAGDNINPEGYYLRSFLMLADEHKTVMYLSMFIREVVHGFRIPILIGFLAGLVYSFRRVSFGRDVPLLVYALLLSGVVFHHLTKTNILESRYLFSLIPFVFPWAGHGLNCLLVLGRYRWNHFQQVAWLGPTRLIPLCVLISGVMVFGSLRLTKDEAFQKSFGLAIRDGGVSSSDSIMGGGTFARSGYYAGIPYRKLPPDPVSAWNRIAASPSGYVIVRAASAGSDPLVSMLNESGQFERVFADQENFRRFLIYRFRATSSRNVAQALK